MQQDENRYEPADIEAKWQKKWEDEKTFSPDVTKAQNPYYNLMMFPYPSAEGLHVGNMYAFTGADVYARYNRMQGKDVLEPIGLDGFGIHSENYALKVGHHPKVQAQVAEKNFYRQLRSIGNSFDWQRTVETYDPSYYKWTQWLFIQLFKAGLAYRDTALVNWCPKDLTVLSDEQVIDGLCERCSTKVEKKNLEQWFFRITKYADRLLNNIEGLKWSEKVKIAQKNWIGKSEGAEVEFEIDSKANYVLLHGFTGSVEVNFFPWLKEELGKRGNSVWAQNLPNTNDPNIEEQVEFVLKNASFDANTILVGHSLGNVVALRVLEKLQNPIKKVILAAAFAEPGFLDHERIFEKKTDWSFDFAKIKRNVKDVVLLRASNDTAVPQERSEFIRSKIGGVIVDFRAEDDHITGEKEPVLLQNVVNSLKVFTTRPDTLFGATFMVVSPEHELVGQIVDGGLNIEEKIKNEVREYVEKAKQKTDIERTGEGKEKTGVFSGLYAINPVNNEKIPVWVADYVLAGYGTGAIMAVPAHDSRDLAFAKKYDLPIIEVIKASDDSVKADEPYEGSGVLINSEEWNGIQVPSEMVKVLDSLESKGLGKRRANYHLRDWLISRQRYWGPPIPMNFCSNCAKNGEAEVESMPGWFSVPEKDLPVLLPDVEDWKPMGTGKSPLANHPEFYKTKCPNCSSESVRETDVSDTFLDSSWYFLRYPSTDVESEPFDTERTKKWLPVDMYIGGAEHSVLHLLYSRFVTMALKDLGFLDFEEPFDNFFAHGLIIKDGAKMSKSKGNVVVPDEYISKYGADTLRAYLMFLGPYSDGGDFRDSGIEGMFRFIRKAWKLFSRNSGNEKELSAESMRIMHKTIKGVSRDISEFGYNTAIAKLMEWYNFLIKQDSISKSEIEVYLKLLAPFAPHMSEELWASMGNTGSIHVQRWPEFDESHLITEKVLIIVQINGKKRGEFEFDSSKIEAKDEVEARAREAVSKHLESVEVKKTIYVPGKLVNIVV